MKSQLKLELRPNNQLTLTIGSWRKPTQEAYKSAYLTNNEIQASRNFKQKIEGGKRIIEDARQTNVYRSEIGIKPSKRHLDIISKSQRAKKKPLYTGNTPKSFTRQSGQKLRECGAAIDIASEGILERCREVTLTLPANHEKAFKALADYSGYAINRLFQPIRRKYGSECHWFFVWEYQKRGALHIHICVFHECPCTCKEIAEKLIEQWHTILCDISEKSGTCLFTDKSGKACTIRKNHQNHTAPIQKAVGSYFSKYAGKLESKQAWYCQKYPVSRFWGSCQAIKNIIKENSLRYDLDLFREQETQTKFESIIENVLSKLQVTSTSSYDFDIQLSGKARLNRAKDGTSHIIHEQGKNVASGTRYTFYFDSKQFDYAYSLVEKEMQFF